jgi:hypothetical protein
MRCGDLQRSFWGWPEQDWIDLIDPGRPTGDPPAELDSQTSDST